MTTIKGMSQILSLVVGASILMMVALLLGVTSTDIIGGGVSDRQASSCTNSIDSLCDVRSEIDAPAQCVGLDTSVVSKTIKSGEGSSATTVSEGPIESGHRIECQSAFS